MRGGWAISICCLLTIILGGCTEDPVGRTVPVKGRVTLGEQPPKTGSVVYWPDADKGNTSPFEAAAQIAPDGTYELITRGKHGAKPGAYKVTVTVQEPSDAKDPYSRLKPLVPTDYLTKENTPLSREVVESPAAGAYDLVVK